MNQTRKAGMNYGCSCALCVLLTSPQLSLNARRMATSIGSSELTSHANPAAKFASKLAIHNEQGNERQTKRRTVEKDVVCGEAFKWLRLVDSQLVLQRKRGMGTSTERRDSKRRHKSHEYKKCTRKLWATRQRVTCLSQSASFVAAEHIACSQLFNGRQARHNSLQKEQTKQAIKTMDVMIKVQTIRKDARVASISSRIGICS